MLNSNKVKPERKVFHLSINGKILCGQHTLQPTNFMLVGSVHRECKKCRKIWIANMPVGASIDWKPMCFDVVII